MQYYLTSKDDDAAGRAAAALEADGFDVLDEYHEDAVVIVLGGDGSILHAAREYPGSTILPVRTGTSKGHRTSVEEDELLEAVEAAETGERGSAYHVEDHHYLTATSDAVDLPTDFLALNDVCLHHREPTMAAEFAVDLHTDAGRRTFPDLVGDGLVVATPFGSSAYFRSITGTTFERGIGVAFNNVHWPEDAPEYVRLPSDATVEVRVTETANAATAVLTRDNHPDRIPLEPDAPVAISRSDRQVSILRLDAR